jgi:hypothetical protein
MRDSDRRLAGLDLSSLVLTRRERASAEPMQNVSLVLAEVYGIDFPCDDDLWYWVNIAQV